MEVFLISGKPTFIFAIVASPWLTGEPLPGGTGEAWRLNLLHNRSLGWNYLASKAKVKCWGTSRDSFLSFTQTPLVFGPDPVEADRLQEQHQDALFFQEVTWSLLKLALRGTSTTFYCVLLILRLQFVFWNRLQKFLQIESGNYAVLWGGDSTILSFHLCCTAIARPLASLHTCIEAAAVPGPAAVEALFQHELGPAVLLEGGGVAVVWLLVTKSPSDSHFDSCLKPLSQAEKCLTPWDLRDSKEFPDRRSYYWCRWWWISQCVSQVA